MFSLSFVVALSGAMTPGPLFTYTVVKSLRAGCRGFFTGARIIGGHAMIESVLVVGLLLACGLFVALFGIYLGVAPFFESA